MLYEAQRVAHQQALGVFKTVKESETSPEVRKLFEDHPMEPLQNTTYPSTEFHESGRPRLRLQGPGAAKKQAELDRLAALAKARNEREQGFTTHVGAVTQERPPSVNPI